MKVIDLKKQPKNSRFYSLVSFTKPHEKPWKRKHSFHCFVSQHFFTWGWDQCSPHPHLQIGEECWFFIAVAVQAGQKFQSNLWRKQISLIFNDCQDMLENVDEIIMISLSFPVIRVFNRRLRDIEVGLFYNHFLNDNRIARLKVLLKLVLNHIASEAGCSWE